MLLKRFLNIKIIAIQDILEYKNKQLYSRASLKSKIIILNIYIDFVFNYYNFS